MVVYVQEGSQRQMGFSRLYWRHSSYITILATITVFHISQSWRNRALLDYYSLFSPALLLQLSHYLMFSLCMLLLHTAAAVVSARPAKSFPVALLVTMAYSLSILTPKAFSLRRTSVALVSLEGSGQLHSVPSGDMGNFLNHPLPRLYRRTGPPRPLDPGLTQEECFIHS